MSTFFQPSTTHEPEEPLKGYRRKERAPWSRLHFEWMSLVYLSGAIFNVLFGLRFVPW